MKTPSDSYSFSGIVPPACDSEAGHSIPDHLLEDLRGAMTQVCRAIRVAIEDKHPVITRPDDAR